MIAALVAGIALQAGGALGTFTVRVGNAATTVPVVRERAGPMVRLDLIAAPLGGSVRSVGNGTFTVAVAGTSLELTAGAPFVRAGADVVPLPYEPVLRDGRILAPFTLVTELLPRVASGVTFDGARRELRMAVAPRSTTPVPVAKAAPAPRSPARSTTATPARSATSPASRTAAIPAPRRGERTHIVVVDAGHGGPDRGMSGPIGQREKIYEKDIALQVARALRTELRERKVEVVMTRDADTLIALGDRGRIANQRRGDLFISIHVNAANPRWSNPGAARGFETYFLSEAKTEDARRVEQMENEVVKYDIEAPVKKDDPLGFILRDMEQNQHLRESSALAAIIQRHVARTHPGPNRGVKQAGFVVLISALMPAVLVEIGFGTNAAEARYLSTPEKQRELARAIADAAVEYLSKYDRRSSVEGQGR